MFGVFLENIRRVSPLIHSITNYVSANDCANILLAAGASPVMADDAKEVFDIASICAGLNINIGTMNTNKLSSMEIAGRRANELGHPVVLDPVGAGASGKRTETALKLLEEIRFSAVRGNLSEIKALASVSNSTKGVNADQEDKITEENLDEVIFFAKAFAKKIGAVAVITGEIDIVTEGERVCCIRNGHSKMSVVTGTGCQLSALTAAFLSVNRNKPLEAAAAAVSAMGLAGEIAYQRLGPMDGNASYRNYMIDAIYHLTPEELEKGARYDFR